MLIKANTLRGYKLDCRDGQIGKVDEFYFDDQHWTIRYLVADAGNWLTGRQVLISPHALAAVSEEKRSIIVHLTRKQIEDSPSLGSDMPVSRQFQEAYYGYFGWPMYWGGPYLWGASPYPYMTGAYSARVADPTKPGEPAQTHKPWDPHLRSTQDVTGHHIHATDGDIGHVEDFAIDDKTWEIRYLIVDTRNWWPAKKVLISPQWIERVSWDEAKVFINLSRDMIRQSPECTERSLPTREYEIELHRHYDRRGYWHAGAQTP